MRLIYTAILIFIIFSSKTNAEGITLYVNGGLTQSFLSLESPNNSKSHFKLGGLSFAAGLFYEISESTQWIMSFSISSGTGQNTSNSEASIENLAYKKIGISTQLKFSMLGFKIGAEQVHLESKSISSPSPGFLKTSVEGIIPLIGISIYPVSRGNIFASFGIDYTFGTLKNAISLEKADSTEYNLNLNVGFKF